MTAGLEDAVELAHTLDPQRTAENGSPPSLEEALQIWEQKRLPVVHGYQERSRAVSARTGRRRPPQVAAPS
jgi:2-polyprenyl-6-methoxyphenol hydroxylase-like FAD-dependent oxidoreductase